jgi:hypothetical protein
MFGCPRAPHGAMVSPLRQSTPPRAGRSVAQAASTARRDRVACAARTQRAGVGRARPRCADQGAVRRARCACGLGLTRRTRWSLMRGRATRASMR